jgi:outer membrane protein OmpA-like peptidoglycan-associated protein
MQAHEDVDEHWLARRVITWVLWAIAAVLFCGLLYLWVNGSDDAAGSPTGTDPSAPESTTGTTSGTGATTTLQSSEATTTIQPSTSTAATTATTAVEPSTVPPAVEPPATSDPNVGTAPPPAPEASDTIPPGLAAPGYPTSPDGSPLPLVVIFDVDTVTISGQIPSQAAKDRLAALAIANSQFPDVALVDNMVINPAVPISVGVRVIELNSVRFPEGSASILPDHAKELDRVVTIMQALPNLSVVVVGHADQRGDDMTNFAISDERARAVVNYLLYLGISPARLSSRAAGESDLLTLGNDDAALALNRRTEFIMYGLLVE